jgi:hypothetical protein
MSEGTVLSRGDAGGNEAALFDAIADLAEKMHWPLRAFEHGGDRVVVAGLGDDPVFEQLVWIRDAAGSNLRCLLVVRGAVPEERRAAVLEVCARVNDGLIHGCLEYDFTDRTLGFRDSTELAGIPPAAAVERTTARLLTLGSRYAEAIARVLSGMPPGEAVGAAERG